MSIMELKEKVGGGFNGNDDWARIVFKDGLVPVNIKEIKDKKDKVKGVLFDVEVHGTNDERISDSVVRMGYDMSKKCFLYTPEESNKVMRFKSSDIDGLEGLHYDMVLRFDLNHIFKNYKHNHKYRYDEKEAEARRPITYEKRADEMEF